jgi:hypothetical protein
VVFQKSTALSPRYAQMRGVYAHVIHRFIHRPARLDAGYNSSSHPATRRVIAEGMAPPIPLILAVVLIILGLLLRAIVAPLILTATVVLSFAALVTALNLDIGRWMWWPSKLAHNPDPPPAQLSEDRALP